MANLLDVIQRIRTNRFEESDWLYIAGSAKDLTLKTEADLGCPEFAEDSNDEIGPAGFVERQLQSTIDVDTVAQCIVWADQLSGAADDDAALDIIRYYIQFDAWPQTLNAADPPPADEILRHLDREFYDKLGPEDSSKKCRRDGCDRGIVRFSDSCRRHHFENICKRPCPFDD